MASSIKDASSGGFPPVVNLSSALLSSSPSVLGAKSFAGPNTGYPIGLVLNAALNENDSGRFSLVSGYTVASNAAAVAANEVDHVQELLDSAKKRIAILDNDAYTDSEKDRQRLLLKFDIEDIGKAIKSAGVGDFNLLDASHSSGVKLNLETGEFKNIGTTRQENIDGHNRNFSYKENEISFQAQDLLSAFEDFQQLETLTYPNTESSQNSNGNLYTLNRFQNAVDQARSGLSDFRVKLTQSALEKITISDEPNEGAISNGVEARQLASRLAQQLSNESFNISANGAAKYFSLFT
jgi:hypothetical protein